MTIAIPCFNAEKYLSGALESLMEQSERPDEILVIDDGSTDLTAEIAKKFEVKLIEHGSNQGLACARNSAIENAKGDIVAFFDADTVSDRKNLERIKMEFFQDEIAGVGGQEFFSSSSNHNDLWRNLFWRQTHGNKRLDDCWMLMGLVSAYRKTALVEIGGFNEDFRTNGEDVDIGLRLSQAGYRLVYLPEIGVYHRRSDSLKSLLALIYRHAFWQSRAFRSNGINPNFQMVKALRWFFISTGSSFLRHRNPMLGFLSPICCMSAFIGRIAELISGKGIHMI